MNMEDKLELIRAITRSLAFLIPLVTLCIALFVLDDIQDTIVGAIITAATAASIFYYKSKRADNVSTDRAST